MTRGILIPELMAPKLTAQQIELLLLLMDGNWHERSEIRRKIKNYISSNISGRIIRPLEDLGIVEQEERPIKEGSRKMKKMVRISKKTIDERSLHQIIMYSANDLVLGGGSETFRPFFLKIRNQSMERLRRLDDKSRLEEEETYWKHLESQVPESKSWSELVALTRLVAVRIGPHCKTEASVRDIAFGIACDARPDLYNAALIDDTIY